MAKGCTLLRSRVSIFCTFRPSPALDSECLNSAAQKGVPFCGPEFRYSKYLNSEMQLAQKGAPFSHSSICRYSGPKRYFANCSTVHHVQLYSCTRRFYVQWYMYPYTYACTWVRTVPPLNSPRYKLVISDCARTRGAARGPRALPRPVSTSF